MKFPNQGAVVFQDEKELVNFITGQGNASTAANGLIGRGAYRELDTQVALVADNSVQSVFGANKGQFTVVAGQHYVFEGYIVLNQATTNAHTVLFSLVLATAVLANPRGLAIVGGAADDTPGAAFVTNLDVLTANVVVPSSQVAEAPIYVKGLFDCTTGGTVQPAINFSTSPGTTSTIELGTWFSVMPTGPNGLKKFGAVT